MPCCKLPRWLYSNVADDRFTLLIYDTAGGPEQARTAVQAALANGARLILGPVFSAAVKAAGEEAAGSGVNILAFFH